MKYKAEHMGELVFDNITTEVHDSKIEDLYNDKSIKDIIDIGADNVFDNLFDKYSKGIIQEIDLSKEPELTNKLKEDFLEGDINEIPYFASQVHDSMPDDLRAELDNIIKEQYLPEIINKAVEVFEVNGYDVNELTPQTFKEQFEKDVELSGQTALVIITSAINKAKDEDFGEYEITERESDKLFNIIRDNVREGFDHKIIDFADDFIRDEAVNEYKNNKEEIFFEFFNLDSHFDVRDKVIDELINHIPLQEIRDMSDEDIVNYIYEEGIVYNQLDNQTVALTNKVVIDNLADALTYGLEDKIEEIGLDLYNDTVVDWNNIKEGKSLDDLIKETKVDEKESKDIQDRDIEER